MLHQADARLRLPGPDWIITDGSSNSRSCNQTITVNDLTTRQPLPCPTGITVQCFSLLPAAYTTLAQFTTAGGSASDNCALNITTFSLVSQTGSGTCPRTVTRTYSIKDSCNNTSTCSQVFSVADNTLPSISCPAGATVQCFGLLPAAYANLAAFTADGGSASDNCGLVSSTFTMGEPVCFGLLSQDYHPDILHQRLL